MTSERRDSGYLLGLDSAIGYLLVLLARAEPPAAAALQARWHAQEAALGRPLLVNGHHFHHANPEGDAAALAFAPGAASDKAP